MAEREEMAKAEPTRSIPYWGIYSCVTRIIVEYGPKESLCIGDPESLVAICGKNAVPDLIEALKGVLPLAIGHQATQGANPKYDARVDAAFAALTKAEPQTRTPQASSEVSQ